MNAPRVLTILGLCAALAACGGQRNIPDPEPQESLYGDEGSGADTYGSGGAGGFGGEEMPDDSMDPMAGELTDTVYFEFDSSDVAADYVDVVNRHALQLADNPMWSVRLEGHADERGSREYNIGLGERRAQAVRRMLMLQGASAEQISTVSFGEERPANFGSDEMAYAENRRVVFTYLSR